jgi:hypothetical protein
MRARVHVDQVQLVDGDAWIYTTGEVAGRLPVVAWVTMLSWQREPEVARRQGLRLASDRLSGLSSRVPGQVSRVSSIRPISTNARRVRARSCRAPSSAKIVSAWIKSSWTRFPRPISR